MDNQTEKTLTWQQLKDLANSLTEEQLQQQVRYWGDEHGGHIDDANILDEDYVSDGDNYAPKSQMDPESVAEDVLPVPAGTVMLWVLS